MSDIVERLRENNPKMPTRDRYEAADIIEVLRAEKLHYVSLIAQKDRVIERLQNELAKRDYGTQQIMRDEIEKERAASIAMGEAE